MSFSPPVVQRKREKGTPSEIRVDGMMHYYPKTKMTILEAEQKRNQIMQTEDGEERKALVKETLAERRKAIIDDKKSIRKLKLLFPYIFGSNEVSVFELWL